jgi:2-amino-4-hydroxy-6-hydroxymethyldihydropteridine diphosphokinase
MGSNIEPWTNISRGLSELRNVLKVEAVSTTWETPPVGTSGPNFYNTAVLAVTSFLQQDLINIILRPIESRLGRVRTSDKYAPRTIDLDIILFDGQLVEPRLWSLPFIAVPVAEIFPDYRHPCSGLTLLEAAEEFKIKNDLIPHPEGTGGTDLKTGQE